MEPASLVEKSEIYGRNEDKEMIISMLVREDRSERTKGFMSSMLGEQLQTSVEESLFLQRY